MITKRFALSLRSKENAKTAFNEEVIIHKNTGEILVKSPTGDIISYNYFTRLKNSLNHATELAYGLDVVGKIYSINLDDFTLPDVIEFEDNIIHENHIIETTNSETFSKFIILLDLDTIIPIENDFVVETELNPVVNLEATIRSADGSEHQFSVSLPLKEMNSTVHSMVYNGLHANKLSITGISLGNSSAIINVRNILSNIILITD